MALYIESGRTYLLINNRSGTALDLSMRPEDNNKVHGWRRHGGINQQWEITFADQGWYFKNLWNGKYLSHVGEPENGSQIYVTDQPFLWYIVADTGAVGTGRVSVPGSTQEIDLSAGEVQDGTIIHLWNHHNEGQQIWLFEQV